jgi:hypothetical protein
MNAAYIDEVVSNSLAGERSLYVHHVPDPERYVQSIRQRFLDKRIEPALRTVIIEPHIVHLVDLPAGTHIVYFVTEDDPLSVFYDPSCESFGAAWGPDESTGQYIDLGFRSDDVLAMAAA